MPSVTNKNPRGTWKGFKKQTKRLTPFPRFIQDKISTAQNITKNRERILWYIGIFLISASLYIVAYSSYFDVTPSKVLIDDSADGIDISIAYRTIEDLYGKNVFLINREEIALSLKKYEKNISHITIDRLYPNGLKILFETYPSVFKLHIPWVVDKEWGLTSNGIVIPKSKVKHMPTLVLDYIGENKEGDTLFDYKEIMSEVSARSITKIIKYIGDNWGEMKIVSLQYFQLENEIHISFENGGKILFTLKDFSKQDINGTENIFLKNEILNLKTYIESNKKEIFAGNFSYIDARVPGKIFICKDKTECKKNLFMIYGDFYK